jgi:two-component system chemotaxis sensor kinase CheA
MQDPLKYFRVEAREIVEQLQASLLELERGDGKEAIVQKLLRLAHTLKGAARVVKQLEIARISHELEDLLVPLREAAQPTARNVVEPLLKLVDELAALVAALAQAPSPAPLAAAAAATAGQPPVAPPRGSSDSTALSDEPLRVASAPAQHVENLMDGVAEVGFQLASVRQALPGLAACRSLAEQLAERLEPRRSVDWAPHQAVSAQALAAELETRLARLERETSNHVERAGRELSQVRDRVDQLRLIAASSMFGTLERATRDSAVSLGKQAQFSSSGGDIRLDADVLSAVQRALVQAVRNAVAHGIETADERRARGKPELGRVQLEVQRRGKQICFVCHDDGRGVDLASVRREAERLGRFGGAQEPASTEGLLSLLLHGGISTSKVVSEVSGRGVGLDLIREALSSVGGSVALRTQPGAGTVLELTVPASLSALDALLVESGGEINALPLKSVVQALRLPTAELNRSAEATSVLFEGQVVPFFPLSVLLRRGPGSERRSWSTVVLQAQHGLLALGVDRLLGAEGIVARALPDSADVDATVIGVTLDADGNPRLLLDPDGLLAAASRTPLVTAHRSARKRSVLVIDDSLTTRMLEQSILESAGYEVSLATCAEQGLEMALSKTYDLFLVDVEMPGMDGFAFVERVRADPRLAATPAVLVTSRASPKDLARGRAVGASDHIAKGEFDQVDFLERIGRLTR